MNRLIRSLLPTGFCLSFTPHPSVAATSFASDSEMAVKSHSWQWSAPEKIASAQEMMDYLKDRLNLYQAEMQLKQEGEDLGLLKEQDGAWILEAKYSESKI